MNSSRFYKDLPKHSISITELLSNEMLFKKIPIGWHVVVTKVEPEIQALNSIHFKDINLAVTGIITTLLNTVKNKSESNIICPYFFGGNEATFIVPYKLLKAVTQALKSYRAHIKKTFSFNVHIGSLPIKDIYNYKQKLKIARLKINDYLTTPVVIGKGLKFAKNKIKNTFDYNEGPLFNDLAPDLSGMECRWHEIKPDNSSAKIICLFVETVNEKSQAKIFRKILGEIEYVFGDLNKRNPITTSNLKLDSSIKKIRNEMRARVGKKDSAYLFSNWLITIFGSYYFKFFSDGKKYLYRVTQLSNTLKIDGAISTVLKGNQNQLNKLKMVLDDLESRGAINYGIHVSEGAIISCYVQDRNKNHIHFIDGVNGGYQNAKLFCRKKTNKKLLNYA